MMRLNDLHKFQSKHKTIALIIWLFTIPLSFVLYFLAGWSSLWAPAIATILIGYLILALLSRHESMLLRRIEADNRFLWNVQVNGVIAGTIPDFLYAKILHSAWLDTGIYMAQITNLVQVISRVVNIWFIAIPLGVIWLGVICFFFAPNTFASLLYTLQQITPEQVSYSTHITIKFLALSSMIFVFTSIWIGSSLGFVNCFHRAISKSIRATIGCAADGEVSMQLIVIGTATTKTES